MKSRLRSLLAGLVALVLCLGPLGATPVQAALPSCHTSLRRVTLTNISPASNFVTENNDPAPQITFEGLDKSAYYIIAANIDRGGRDIGIDSESVQADTNGNLTFTVPKGWYSDDPALVLEANDFKTATVFIKIQRDNWGPVNNDLCEVVRYSVTGSKSQIKCSAIAIYQIDHTSKAQGQGCYEEKGRVELKATLTNADGTPYKGPVGVEYSGTRIRRTIDVQTGGKLVDFSNINVAIGEKYTGSLYDRSGAQICTTSTSPVKLNCSDEEIKQPPADVPGAVAKFELCSQIPDGTQRGKCSDCVDGKDGIWTAVGCIPKKADGIVGAIIGIGLGIAGGVAILMIMGAGFMLSTSQSDPKKATEAKDMITAAVTGLLFIIFSVTILQFIGVSILHIPGFGG